MEIFRKQVFISTEEPSFPTIVSNTASTAAGTPIYTGLQLRRALRVFRIASFRTIPVTIETITAIVGSERPRRHHDQ